MTRIAFLGLGAMGARMATRLVDAGHDVTVWNRSAGAIAPLVQQGATAADTPGAAAAGSEIVITMVTDDAAARDVWMGPDGALSGLESGALAIEASTVSPQWGAELTAAVVAAGGGFVDAPVAGSRPQAEAGALLFLAGGTDADIERFRPVAEAMGKAVLHAGPAGQGIVLKLMVNAMLAVQTATLGELLRFGASQGMEPALAAKLLGDVPVTSPSAVGLMGLILEGSHNPLFTVDLLVKDLGYLLTGASGAPVMSQVAETFAAAQSRGLGDRNITVVAD